MVTGVYLFKVCHVFSRFRARVSFNALAGPNGQCVRVFAEASKRTIEKSGMLFCSTRVILSI